MEAQINLPPSTFLSVGAGQADTLSMDLFQACLSLTATAAAAATSVSSSEEVRRPLTLPLQQQERRPPLTACKGAAQPDRQKSRLQFIISAERRAAVTPPLMCVTVAQENEPVCIHSA